MAAGARDKPVANQRSALPVLGPARGIYGLAARPGFTAGVLGTLLLLLLLGVRLGFRADSSSVYFRSHRVEMECAIRHQFGLPCPACGLTRSVVLTLHGDVQQASRLNPAGPLGVLGFVALSIALMYVSYRQQAASPSAVERVQQVVRRALLVYGALVVLAVLGHWLRTLAAARFAGT